MALIKCPECGKEVSDKASACPNCGCPVGVHSKLTESVFHQGRGPTDSDPSWVQEKVQNRRSATVVAIVFDVILSIMTLVGVLLCVVSSDSFIAGIVLLSFGFAGLIISFITTFTLLNRPPLILDEYNGYLIGLSTCKDETLYVNGESTLYEGHYHTEISGDEDGTTSKEVLDRATFILLDGTRCQIIIAKNKYTFKYDSKGTYSDVIQNVFVNNTIVNRKKAKERSDMEKILIKNAKIDALASIDPTNTEKAKEQIDIINKLDNLD